jgi:3-hydroxyisobutyrate dehydrogenase-like beta-hydroxyacid dehydrogenase
MVGTIHAATMEVIHLSRQLNLDPALVVDVVGNGIAGSDYFKLLSESVLTGQPSPGGLGQMCKDVAIVINTIRNSKMHALVASAMSGYFMEAESLGMQDREGADLIQVIQYLQDRPPK